MARLRPRVAACLGLSLALGACVATRGDRTGALEPRFVAVHNAFAAMGLAQVGPIREGSLAQGQEARVPLDLGAGCTTVVAFGGDGVRDVDATLTDARGQVIAHDTTSEPQAVLRACVEGADAYVLTVKAAAGAGSWVVATWAGGLGAAAPSASAPAPAAGLGGAGTCESPIPLVAGTVSGTTRTGESVNSGSCDHSDAREIVYLLEVPRRQRVVLDVDARFDSVLYLRKDDCADETAEIECNDDSPTGGRNKSHIERVLEPGKYFVFVDGYNQESGGYKLTVSVSDVVALSDACRRAPLLALGAVRQVLVEPGRWIEHERPVSRADELETSFPQAAQPVEVAGERAGVGRDEHTPLPEHRIAGERYVPEDKGEMVRGMSRRGEALEGPEPGAGAEHDIDLPAGPGHWRAGEALAQDGCRPAVIEMIVREGDPPEPAPMLELGGERAEMSIERGPGVDQPGGLTPGDPRVRSREGERAGVIGADADHVVVGDLDQRHLQ